MHKITSHILIIALLFSLNLLALPGLQSVGVGRCFCPTTHGGHSSKSCNCCGPANKKGNRTHRGADVCHKSVSDKRADVIICNPGCGSLASGFVLLSGEPRILDEHINLAFEPNFTLHKVLSSNKPTEHFIPPPYKPPRLSA